MILYSDNNWTVITLRLYQGKAIWHASIARSMRDSSAVLTQHDADNSSGAGQSVVIALGVWTS